MQIIPICHSWRTSNFCPLPEILAMPTINLNEHELGFHSSEIGFPNLGDCMAVVLVTDRGLYGWHVMPRVGYIRPRRFLLSSVWQRTGDIYMELALEINDGAEKMLIKNRSGRMKWARSPVNWKKGALNKGGFFGINTFNYTAPTIGTWPTAVLFGKPGRLPETNLSIGHLEDRDRYQKFESRGKTSQKLRNFLC